MSLSTVMPPCGRADTTSHTKPIRPSMHGMGGRVWRVLIAAWPNGASTYDIADVAYRGCRLPENFEASIRCQVQRLAREKVATHTVASVRRGRVVFYVARALGDEPLPVDLRGVA